MELTSTFSMVSLAYEPWFFCALRSLARMFHELLSRDREDGRATRQSRETRDTSQGTTPEDARKDGHIRGRSRLFMKHPG